MLSFLDLCKPKIVLLDEPLAALDPLVIQDIQKSIDQKYNEMKEIEKQHRISELQLKQDNDALEQHLKSISDENYKLKKKLQESLTRSVKKTLKKNRKSNKDKSPRKIRKKEKTS